MYFPFLTYKMKCDTVPLNIANCQNVHNITIAIRALVEFFRLVKHKKELNQKILIFSISHNHRSVRIYSHYPVIEEDKTTFYYHSIHEFSFTEQDSKKKWITYKFIKNVYNHHSLNLHKLICLAINDLPTDINFDFSQSASFQSTPQGSQQSNTESVLGKDDSQSSFLGSQEVTSTMLFTQVTEPVFKKPRNQQTDGQQCWNLKNKKSSVTHRGFWNLENQQVYSTTIFELKTITVENLTSLRYSSPVS